MKVELLEYLDELSESVDNDHASKSARKAVNATLDEIMSWVQNNVRAAPRELPKVIEEDDGDQARRVRENMRVEMKTWLKEFQDDRDANKLTSADAFTNYCSDAAGELAFKVLNDFLEEYTPPRPEQIYVNLGGESVDGVAKRTRPAFLRQDSAVGEWGFYEVPVREVEDFATDWPAEIQIREPNGLFVLAHRKADGYYEVSTGRSMTSDELNRAPHKPVMVQAGSLVLKCDWDPGVAAYVWPREHDKPTVADVQPQELKQYQERVNSFSDFAEAFCSGWNTHRDVGDVDGPQFSEVLMERWAASGGQQARQFFKRQSREGAKTFLQQLGDRP